MRQQRREAQPVTRLRANIAFAVGLMMLAVLSGCSTVRPQKNERRGLFSQMGRPVSADSVSSGAVAASASDEPQEKTYNGKPARWAHGDKAAVVAHENVERNVQVASKSWVWPLAQVQVTSEFGSRGGTPHEGIDLQAKKGTPVYAVEDALVLYSGKKISGYGLMLVLRHAKGLSTVYAHNSKLFVRGGEKVKKGQKIALSGATGRVSGPHLHFEVRDGVQAVDPLQLLSLAQNEKPNSRSLASEREGGRVRERDEDRKIVVRKGAPARKMASAKRKAKRRL